MLLAAQCRRVAPFLAAPLRARHAQALGSYAGSPPARASSSSVQPGGIFCNRELPLSQIESVGFDMDYTLAQYSPAFDLLAYEGAKRKLVQEMGYPAAVAGLAFEPERFSRGLVIDKQRGNLLKVDRFKYVAITHVSWNRLARAAMNAIS